MRRALCALAAFLGALAFASSASAHRDGGLLQTNDDPKNPTAFFGPHGSPVGKLPPTKENVTLVGQVTVHDAIPGLVADVGVLGEYAYLGSFRKPDCTGPSGQPNDGGVYIVNIDDPADPVEVGFIRTNKENYVGEGVQVVHIGTPKFNGDLLVVNNESCGRFAINPNKNFELQARSGVSLYDVSNPLKPVRLVENFGDFTDASTKVTPHQAHEIHSAFAWDAGDKAYLVMVDDNEFEDVDILDITDPRHPKVIAEYDLNDFGGIDDPGGLNPDGHIDQPGLALVSSFLHDMVVTTIGGRYIMLLSYWDGGYVKLDVTDPTNPVFLGDSDFSYPDPLRLEYGQTMEPEGNAHEAEFTAGNTWILAADEDFDPYPVVGRVTGGTFNGARFQAGQGSGTPQIPTDVAVLSGPLVFVGNACGSVSAALSADHIALVERGVCTFQTKLDNVESAGYQAGIVFNSNNPLASNPCEGLVGMLADGDIPFLFVSRSNGYKMLDVTGYDPDDCFGSSNPPVPAPGLTGTDVNVEASVFDGWGYVHLLDGDTLGELDVYGIPEGQLPAYAADHGDLSVHEVGTDPTNDNRAYLSYYNGGFRVIEVVETESGCAPEGAPCIREVGRYIHEAGDTDGDGDVPELPDGTPIEGNNFWGVETWDDPDTPGEETYVLASDRDSGLWIFRYDPED